jgi:hypothetical protein
LKIKAAAGAVGTGAASPLGSDSTKIIELQLGNTYNLFSIKTELPTLFRNKYLER